MQVQLDLIKGEAKRSLITSLLLILLGILFLINQSNFFKIAIIVIGYMGLFFGLLQMFSFYLKFNTPKTREYLKNGLICFFLGLIFIIKAQMIKDVFIIILSAYLIFRNANRIRDGLYLISEKLNFGKWIIIFSTLNIILSFFLVINPFTNIPFNILSAMILFVCEALYLIESIFIMCIKMGKTNNEK